MNTSELMIFLKCLETQFKNIKFKRNCRTNEGADSMNSEQIIQDLLKQEEDEQLEFKEKVNKEQIGSYYLFFFE